MADRARIKIILDSVLPQQTRRLSKCFKRGFSIKRKEWHPERKFNFFLELPAEIRERIYEIACDQDREILEEHFTASKPPPEPAIACASRLLRREALPVFYRHYRFPVTNNPSRLINAGCMPPSQEWRAARWYHRLDSNKLRMIRKLELYYCFGQFNVDFEARGNSYTVKQTACGSQRLVDVSPNEEREHLLALIMSILDELVKSPGVGSFAARDFDRLELEVVGGSDCC